MLKKREWIYVQPPMAYEVFCDICGNPYVEWSEFEGMVWCWRCLKDTHGTGGVFDGPVPINTCKILGICFDRIDLKTGQWLIPEVVENKVEYKPVGNLYPAIFNPGPLSFRAEKSQTKRSLGGYTCSECGTYLG